MVGIGMMASGEVRREHKEAAQRLTWSAARLLGVEVNSGRVCNPCSSPVIESSSSSSMLGSKTSTGAVRRGGEVSTAPSETAPSEATWFVG
jgi:hypothetical protein